MKPRLQWIIIVMLLVVISGMAAWLKSEYTASVPRILYGDINNNGCKEKYILKKHQLAVWEGSRLIWQTPADWQINQIKLADADNNGQKELLLVVWKKGSFGISKPFWFKGPDSAFTCHLFVYRMMADRIKAEWCSSALEHPILHLDVKDSNTDGRNELLVTEGPGYGFAYSLRRHIFRQNTTWVWNGWGFERTNEPNP